MESTETSKTKQVWLVLKGYSLSILLFVFLVVFIIYYSLHLSKERDIGKIWNKSVNQYGLDKDIFIFIVRNHKSCCKKGCRKNLHRKSKSNWRRSLRRGYQFWRVRIRWRRLLSWRKEHGDMSSELWLQSGSWSGKLALFVYQIQSSLDR